MNTLGKRNKGKMPPFVALPMRMINGPAYKELSHSSAHALPYFFAKVKLRLDDPQRYSSPFGLSYGEALRYGFSRTTFGRVIVELMQKGFIDPHDKGGLRGKGKSSNQFTLSQRWMQYGTDAFEERSWRCFEPPLAHSSVQKWALNKSKFGEGGTSITA